MRQDSVWCLWRCTIAYWITFSSVSWTVSMQTHSQLNRSPAYFSNCLEKILQVFKMALMGVPVLITKVFSLNSKSLKKVHHGNQFPVCGWHSKPNIAVNWQAWLWWLLNVNGCEFWHIVPYSTNVTYCRHDTQNCSRVYKQWLNLIQE